ncbi:MAG TPA: oxaloacetate decarboxylase [Bacteroidales bacterium]|nr:oxaloacetate decarboxylase [Bacteroidales bacterium]
MKKQIKFSLIYRDMWQSSGKYVPRVDQLKRIAPVIIDMGCFSRVETNGGAFEQVNLLYGENPNTAVREWVKPFNEAGIQTHMLERALNGIRMFPVPADVRKLMYKVKKAQGVDIARSFCGLNDHRNLELSIKYAKEAGMISQATLSITHSPLHTVEYFMGVVDKAVEYGTDEICLKDMAGVGRPATLGKLVKAIKDKYPHIIVQYHGHTGPGFSVASMLEVARAGADYLDCAMEPLSWGMVHPDVITIRHMLLDDGFDVPDINMNAYMEARSLTQEFMDDFLGYFIDPKNRYLSSLMVDSGLPGGMMGSLMADLKGVHQGINASLAAAGKSELSEDELMVKLFDEVTYIWPLMGYPPLVTPFSQYVKNTALVNVMNLAMGKERFQSIDPNSWDMLLGKAGHLPGPIDPIFVKLAKEQKREFYTGLPQDAYPDALDKYRKEMKDNGWDTGPDDEELFELAMHDTQYRDYKSGAAKERFEAEIAKFKTPKTTVAVNTIANQKPNRSSYSKKEPNESTAIAGFLAYGFNTRQIDLNPYWPQKHNVWNSIGRWRNTNSVFIEVGKEKKEIFYSKTGNKDFKFIIDHADFETKLVYIETGEVDFTVNGDAYFAKVVKDSEGFAVTINGKKFNLNRHDMLLDETHSSEGHSGGEGDNYIKSPMPGKVFKLNVKEGDKVKKGDTLVVVEAMKMENSLNAAKDGVVKKVNAKLGAMVEISTVLVELEDLK